MGLLGGIGLTSALQPKIWQLEAAKMVLEGRPEDILSIPEKAVEELIGMTGDLQNFLFKQALHLPTGETFLDRLLPSPNETD